MSYIKTKILNQIKKCENIKKQLHELEKLLLSVPVKKMSKRDILLINVKTQYNNGFISKSDIFKIYGGKFYRELFQ